MTKPQGLTISLNRGVHWRVDMLRARLRTTPKHNAEGQTGASSEPSQVLSYNKVHTVLILIDRMIGGYDSPANQEVRKR